MKVDLRQAPDELRVGWKPLVASAVGVGLGLSPLPTFTAGVFALQLQHQFGWSRGAILGASSFVTLSLLLCGPIVGRIADKFGARTVALFSAAALGLTMAALGLTTEHIWTYYLLSALMAFASVGSMPIVYGKVISLWFDRRRGMALGITLCTTGLSGMFLPDYAQTLIAHFGWRWAYVGVGLLPLVIAWPTLFFLLPRDAGIEASASARAETAALEGMEIKAAVIDYRFWLIGVAALAAGVGLGGVVFNLVPLLVDRGFKPQVAAHIFGLYGLSVVLGRLGSGWLLDRVWAPLVGFVFLLIPAAAAFMLAAGAHATPLIILVTVMFGAGSGAEFDLVAYLTGRYFGRRNFGALYAFLYAIFGLGSGTAPAAFGAVYDATGSYTPVIFAAGALFVLAAVLMLLLGRYPALGIGPAPAG